MKIHSLTSRKNIFIVNLLLSLLAVTFASTSHAETITMPLSSLPISSEIYAEIPNNAFSNSTLKKKGLKLYISQIEGSPDYIVVFAGSEKSVNSIESFTFVDSSGVSLKNQADSMSKANFLDDYYRLKGLEANILKKSKAGVKINFK